MNKLEAWFGQVTTGHGVSLIGGILLAVVSGQMSWSAAVPALVGGVVLMLWPENTSLSAAVSKLGTDFFGFAPTAVADVKTVADAYQLGVVHGNAAATPAPANAAAAAVGAAAGAAAGATAAAAVKAGLLLALSIGAALALSACSTAPPSPIAVLNAAQTAYQLLAKDEKAAIDTGLLSGPSILLIHQTDNTLYAGIIGWRTAAENGQTVTVATEAAVEATLKGLVAQLTTAKVISPEAAAASSTAIGFLQLLTGA